MGLFSKFEGKMEDAFEGDGLSNAPISPVQIAKKAEKQMRREKMVGAGKQYAPTLYTVLVNPDDDQRLFGYYPTLAGETETYLSAKAAEQDLVMDGQPLVRFIVDDGLKHGKFEVIAEAVAAPIVAQLRQEEMERYGLAPSSGHNAGAQAQQGYGRPAQAAPQYGYPQQSAQAQPAAQAQQQPAQKPPLPYVPEDELDYSIDYGEYTFDSHDFEDQNDSSPAGSHAAAPQAQQAPAPDAAYMGAAGQAVSAAGYNNVAGAQPAAAIPETMVFGAEMQQAAQTPARSNTQARLVDAANNRSYPLRSARMRIGRESNNDIVVRDINASRSHAELRLGQQGVWSISDLGSTNGTYVNDRKVSSCNLSEGDRITIGTTLLTFTYR